MHQVLPCSSVPAAATVVAAAATSTVRQPARVCCNCCCSAACCNDQQQPQLTSYSTATYTLPSGSLGQGSGRYARRSTGLNRAPGQQGQGQGMSGREGWQQALQSLWSGALDFALAPAQLPCHNPVIVHVCPLHLSAPAHTSCAESRCRSFESSPHAGGAPLLLGMKSAAHLVCALCLPAASQSC